MTPSFPPRAVIREVGLRDGLQSIATVLPTARKCEWIIAAHAAGNAATEDVAYLLASMGIATGIDLPRLLALRTQVGDWLEGESLYGTLWRAGLPRTFTNATD